jgi:DNA-binding NarL/FixJ family response regulator
MANPSPGRSCARRNRTLIVDDHAITRAGYRQFLALEPAIGEIGEARSGTEALDRLRASGWDLLLLDIHMPDRGGLDVLKRIVSGYPRTRIIVISGLPEELYGEGVLKAGAHGYLSKQSAGPELLNAVRTVIAGRRYISDFLAERLAENLTTQVTKPVHARLSAREFQIFSKVSAGRKIAEIAAELRLSAKTVSTYRTRVLEKLEFASNAEMTAYALRQGLLQ